MDMVHCEPSQRSRCVFFLLFYFFINCPGTDAMLSVHKLFAHKCEGHGFEFGHPLSELARVSAIFLEDKEKN